MVMMESTLKRNLSQPTAIALFHHLVDKLDNYNHLFDNLHEEEEEEEEEDDEEEEEEERRLMTCGMWTI